jgi:uncharacterized iron-regulated membrane protein
MRRSGIVMPLLLTLLLTGATLSFAEDETSVEQSAAALSKEDQEVIEIMELLEMMELLQNMESVAALEVTDEK